MRRNLPLSQILDGYRGITLAAVTVIAALFIASGLALSGLLDRAGMTLPVTTLLAGSLLLVVLAQPLLVRSSIRLVGRFVGSRIYSMI